MAPVAVKSVWVEAQYGIQSMAWDQAQLGCGSGGELGKEGKTQRLDGRTDQDGMREAGFLTRQGQLS